MAVSDETTLGHIYAYLGRFRGFDRDVKLLLLAVFFSSVVIGLSNIVQPLYLTALGYESTTVGAILGVSALVSVLVLFPTGVLADHYGRKNLLVLSILTYTLAFIIYAMSTNLQLLFLASTLIGISWGTYIGPSNAILTDKTRIEERNYVFSLSSFLSAFAIIIGSLLAGATDITASLLHQVSLETYRTMFWVAVGLNVICTPTLLFVKEPPFTVAHTKRRLTIRSWEATTVLSLVNGLTGFGAGAFMPLLPVYLTSRYSATKAEIGTLFALSSGAMAVANLLAPRLSDKIGQVGTVALTQTLSVVPLTLIPMSPSLLGAGLLYVTRTGLMNMSTPILNAYTMSMVTRDERASVSGATAMAWNGANAAGTAVSGILMDRMLDLPFYIGAFFYASSTVIFHIYFRSRRKSHPE